MFVGSSMDALIGAGSPIINHQSRTTAQAAAQDFEAVFLSQMLNHMFENVETDSLTGDPETEEIYHSMMVEEYGKIIARSGGIGVADYVSREMLKLQEANV